MRLPRYSILPFILILSATCAAAPLDLVPFGYQYRADAPPGQNPPETQWITDGRTDVLAGVMWEEHRPLLQIDFQFATQAPDPSGLTLEVTTNTPTSKQDNRPTWWTRAWESFPGVATRSADGRHLVYRTDRAAIVERLKHYPADMQHEADPHGLLLVGKLRLRFVGAGKPPTVTAIHASGLSALKPIQVRILWGLKPDQQQLPFDGRIEAYNGRIGAIQPIAAGDVAIVAATLWRSPASAQLRGIDAELFYVADDTQEVRYKMGLDVPTGSEGAMRYHPNRTVITVRTASGSFSFAPADLQTGGPILVPSLGFFVTAAGMEQSPKAFAARLAGQGTHTIRQRVRSMPEQSIEHALDDHYTAARPPMPRSPEDPPMQIDVPDPLAVDAWRLAYWHVKRRCIRPDGGDYLLYIWPYQALLGQESWRIAYALDLLGQHAIPESGFSPWFKAQGTIVARGMFEGKEGALNVSGWDINHAQGHGCMLFAMAQHYLLTGDKAWLAAHQSNLCAAAEWIVRQRAQWARRVGPDGWTAGLMPPSELGDYADWRCLYQTNVFYWRGLKCTAQAITDIDPVAGARFMKEADDFRRSILAAVDRSTILSPVVRVSDGTCRRYIPPQPYLRGMARLIMSPYGAGHAGPNWMDGDGGAAALALGILPPDDPRLDETLDVLEDVVYLDNWMVRMHTRQRRPNDPRAWFSIGGYYYQCGYSQSALAHLMRDDVPNFLRSTFNQYAADVDPSHAWQFREHPNRTGEGNGGDKTFEVAAFLERMRAMLVMEDGDTLWLARATPRQWLRQGRHISVKAAPTSFGSVDYEITSEVDDAQIHATVRIPSRRPPATVCLRVRHPQHTPVKQVTVNGAPWSNFDPATETIRLTGLHGSVRVDIRY